MISEFFSNSINHWPITAFYYMSHPGSRGYAYLPLPVRLEITMKERFGHWLSVLTPSPWTAWERGPAETRGCYSFCSLYETLILTLSSTPPHHPHPTHFFCLALDFFFFFFKGWRIGPCPVLFRFLRGQSDTEFIRNGSHLQQSFSLLFFLTSSRRNHWKKSVHKPWKHLCGDCLLYNSIFRCCTR